MEDVQKSTKTDSLKVTEIKRPKTEDDFLMIINYTPLSSSYDYIKQVLPEIYELNTRFRTNNRSYLNTTILNKESKLEFTFNTGRTLQNIQFYIYQLNCEEADSLYKKLQKYYSNKFGEYKEGIANLSEDSDYPYPILHSSQCKLSGFNVIVDLNESHKDCSLMWKYRQKQ